MLQPTSWQSAGDGSSPASPTTHKKLSASASVRSVRVRCIGAVGLQSGPGWFLRLRSLSRWLTTATAHFSGEPVWNESFSIDVLRHMELELWEHNPADGDKLAGKKTVNLTLDVFPEVDPPMGVETVKTFAIPGAGRVELGFTLLPPGSSESEPSTSSEPPKLTSNDKRRSIIGERRTVNRALDQFSEEEASSSVEQLRQVNEALIAMGKPPLTKQEAALILAGEKKRRETLVLPKGVGAAINSAAQSSPNGQETKWMAKRTSIAPRSRDSSAAIYSQFKQQIYLKDKEVADKAKQVDALEQEVLAAKQEVAHQKTLVAALEEKASGLSNQLKTKSMQFLVVFEKVKEEKDALVAANARLREEMADREREHREALARLAHDLDEKVRLAREEGSLSTTLAYSIKLENEKANHGRELARVKSDLEFETEQIRKKAEAEKQGLVLQYEGLLQKERARAAEELRKKKEKSREKKQRLREERLQKEGVTQEMKRMEEKIQGDKRKWEEEREHVRAEQAERESRLERERRENERLAGSIAGLEERIGLLEKKLHQAQAEKQSLAADFAEQQETARGVAEMQLRRVREEAASTRERLETDLEALKLKLHQAGEREQAAVERERREKLELKEAKVKLESECLERAARLERLAGVEQDLRAAQARIEAVQKAAEIEAREKNRLLEEKREADRQAELLEAELRRAHEEAEAKAHELEQQMIAAAAAAARPPSAPMPPPMAPFAGAAAAAAAAAAVGSLGDDDSDSDDGGVGGLLGAIAKGVTLQPVKPDTKPRPHKAEGEVESISEAIALAIARRREMMMLAAPSATLRGDDDTPWDAGDLYE